MKKQQKQGWLKRSFVWIVEPFFTIGDAWRAILPAKANPDELTAFRKLTPGQRWEKVKKPDWTDEQLSKERTWSNWIATIALICSCAILAVSIAAFKDMTVFQFVGALAYSGASFLLFSKKSMWVYALDHCEIILFDEWLKRPEIWFPTSNSKDVF
ncbi:MAG: hypothetical protein ACXWJZ_12495 [Burkholderiaceae bacterium]